MNWYPGWYNSMANAIPQRSYVGRVASEVDGTSFTFTGAAIGTPKNSRMVLVAVAATQGNNTGTITGVTVNGAAATSVVNATSGGAFASNGALFRAAVPTGTTADIVVSTSATTFTCAVDVYALYDLASMTPSATASAVSATSGTLLSTTLNIPASGIAVMHGVANLPATSYTLAGLTEDVDATFGVTNGLTSAAGSNHSMAVETARALSATIAAANDRRTLVAASWR